MLTALADLTITGPGVTVRVHGDGPNLTADVNGSPLAIARLVGNPRRTYRRTREISARLRAFGLHVDVRLLGRTLVKLG